MRRVRRVLVLLVALAAVSSPAFAQATLTGVVRDSSGAVLPGVTVEASSPALIEKVRTAVTDGTGRYQIIDLRPGDYTVTFTLTGFASVRREAHPADRFVHRTVDAEHARRERVGNRHGHRRAAGRRPAERDPAARHRPRAVLTPSDGARLRLPWAGSFPARR